MSNEEKFERVLMRKSGILLHISSLPSNYGIGSLGKSAYEFVDFLVASKVKLWQILPLAMTGYGDSPYQSVCSYSGNPYFIDLDILKSEGLLTSKEMPKRVKTKKVDYAKLYNERYPLLRKAYSKFDINSKGFKKFLQEGKFNDYALFMTIKHKYSVSLNNFPAEYKFRNLLELEKLKVEEKYEYLFWQFLQYEFWKQWKDLKKYANKKGVQIIGDLPLYVACDSVDVWANPKLFKLDENLLPKKLAGVPPDYFSSEGQLWGNPVYNYSEHKKDDYAWWKNRIVNSLEIFDYVRIDHFRGLDRYYEIDTGEKTAINGKWQDGPKNEFFAMLKSTYENINIIAEDLGLIDDGVKKLLKESGFPGMKVLLFAFDGNENNDYLPSNINENSICYTGTHDNDTLYGYVKSLNPSELSILKKRVKKQLDLAEIVCSISGNKNLCKAIIELGYYSKSKAFIIPIQDLLLIGNEGRMNTPSTENNWTFILNKLPDYEKSTKLRMLNNKYFR